MPNAGKSSLLAALTRAKPKIADYPFTTLNPNLGVCFYKNREVTLADIPGLIEGAHKGVGLGDKFLRHIERCKVLIHLIDLTADNLFSNYKKIRSELASYDKSLVKKKEIIFFNKSDCMDKKTVDVKLRNFKFKNKSNYSIISTYNKTDLDKVKKILLKNVS